MTFETFRERSLSTLSLALGLKKKPLMTLMIIAMLGVGIGLNSALFSVSYAVLLKPLPYPSPDELVQIETMQRAGPQGGVPLSPPAIRDISQQSLLAESVTAIDSEAVTLYNSSPPTELDGAGVSGNYFAVLSVRPLLGKVIVPRDATSSQHVAVLSYRLWRQQFGGDPTVIGKSVRLGVQSRALILNSVPPPQLYTIIGVMPPAKKFPDTVDVWLPLSLFPALMENRQFRALKTIVRLKPGVSLRQFNNELQTLALRIGHQFPVSDDNWLLRAARLRNPAAADLQTTLIALSAAVLLVFILICLSTSNLLLANNSLRMHEFGIRVALGASRARIALQVFTEVLVLSLIGGIVGSGLSVVAVHFASMLTGPQSFTSIDVGLNWSVFLYMISLSTVTGIIVAIAPAVSASREPVMKYLKVDYASSKRGSVRVGTGFVSKSFVIGQSALAYIIVVSAVASLISFARLITADLGYRIDNVLALSVHLGPSRCNDLSQCQATVRELLDALRAVPGVSQAAVTDSRPLGGSVLTQTELTVEGQDSHTVAVDHPIQSQAVTPDYFAVLRIPVLSGRGFSDEDRQNTSQIAIVNQSMEKLYFNGKAIGRRFRAGQVGNVGGQNPWLEIVGVVSDSRNLYPGQPPDPEFYRPIMQVPIIVNTDVLLHSIVPASTLTQVVSQTVSSIDKNATISNMSTLDQVLSDGVSQPRLRTGILVAFGLLALMIALVGTFAVMAHIASARTREIGVRMAIGASRGTIFKMIIRQSFELGAFGIGIGVVGVFGMLPLLSRLSFDVGNPGVLVFVITGLSILLTLLIASCIPARRAMHVDPSNAIRYE